MQEKISLLKSLLDNPKKIMITVHRGPDGDALGSALALKSVLSKLNHDVTVISPNDYASFLYWMKGNEDVLIYTENQIKATEITNSSDIIFMLDFNSVHRAGEFSGILKNANSTKVILDHHQDPVSEDADIIISDTKSCSTSQLLFEVLDYLGYKNLIDKDIAECLYAGIMTDTGSFKFNSTTAKTHHIISQLIEMGVNNSKVHDLVYDNYSEDRAKLLGYCLNEKLQIFPETNSAIISLSEDELNRFNFKKGDTEGVVNYALAVKGVIFAIFIAEKEGVVKLSLRSKGDFRANEVSKKYFNGGGHINAAGGISYTSLEETIEICKNIFEEYKPELTK